MTDLPAENTATATMLGAVRFGIRSREANDGDMPPERWTKAQADLIVKLAGGDQTLAQVFWRAIDAKRTGAFLASLTLLAARGLLTIEGGEIRTTNLAMQACDAIIAAERAALQRQRTAA